MLRIVLSLLGIVVFIVVATNVFLARLDYEAPQASPIPGAVNAPVVWDTDFEPRPFGDCARAHPFMAPPGAAGMHADAYQSDVHCQAGVTGENLVVTSRKAGGKLPRMCATFVFLRNGKIVAMCGGLLSFDLVLLDPTTLERLAVYKLPMRPSAFQTLIKRDYSIAFSDSSGGAYLYLDAQDRIVLIDAEQRLQRIAVIARKDGSFAFRQDAEWPLKDYIPNDCFHYDNWFPRGECDMATTVMPDHEGRYWWVTRFGRIGTLVPETGAVSAIWLDGEEIQNAFAVDKEGVYIVSDHAAYGLVASDDGAPEIVWRAPYDRGTTRKVGSINQGSGTTPTLLGDDYVTLTDNADDRVNLLVLRRHALAADESRLICKVPVFDVGASNAENSMIAVDRTILLENNHGYTNSFQHEDWGAVKGGVVRIDVREDENGCDVIWRSPLVVPSVVAKLSAANGIAYYYSFDQERDQMPTWRLVGLDVRTGREVLSVPTGYGRGYNNNWASIAIGPEGIYIGTAGGVVRVAPAP